MRDQFLTPDAVRDLHSRLGQQRRDFLTHKITDSFPAPFQSTRSSISIFNHVTSNSSEQPSSSTNQQHDHHHGSTTSKGSFNSDSGDADSGVQIESGLRNSATFVAEEFENGRSNCVLS